IERRDRLDARAVLRHDVIDAQVPERVDHSPDTLLREPAQVKPADHRMNLGHSGDADGVLADPHDATVRARRHYDEPAVAYVRDQRLLADERIGNDLAVALDFQILRDRLERLLSMHLAAQQESVSDR